MSAVKKFAKRSAKEAAVRWLLRWDRRADGPEEELVAVQRAGWRSVTLGSTILRAETAAIAALAAAAAILD